MAISLNDHPGQAVLAAIAGAARPAAAAAAMNAIGYALAAPSRSERFFDAVGSATFLAGTLIATQAAAVTHASAAVLAPPSAALSAATGVSPSAIETAAAHAVQRAATFVPAGHAAAAAAKSATAAISLYYLHPRQLFLASAVAIWASRLGAFLIYRIRALNGDRRFDAIKKSSSRFAAAWILQAVWNVLTPLPLYIALAIPPWSMRPLNELDAVGAALWAFGFAFESIADAQKLSWQMRMGEHRFSSVNDRGLWSLCRYPNYFGEIVLWTGVFVSAVASLDLSSTTSRALAAIMAISPAFVATLLVKISGIPLQEKMAKKRFAGNQQYADYVARTNLLFPWFPKRLPADDLDKEE